MLIFKKSEVRLGFRIYIKDIKNILWNWEQKREGRASELLQTGRRSCVAAQVQNTLFNILSFSPVSLLQCVTELVKNILRKRKENKDRAFSHNLTRKVT